MTLAEQEPEIGEAVRGIAPRYLEVLLFSLKYIVAAVLFVAFPLFLASLLPSERIREIALSKTFLICFGLIAEGCIAWLLLPAAIRMLRSPRSLAVSVQDRQLGTIYVVATALASFALEYLIGEIEAKFTYRGAGQSWAIALLKTPCSSTRRKCCSSSYCRFWQFGTRLKNRGYLRSRNRTAWQALRSVFTHHRIHRHKKPKYSPAIPFAANRNRCLVLVQDALRYP